MGVGEGGRERAQILEKKTSNKMNKHIIKKRDEVEKLI